MLTKSTISALFSTIDKMDGEGFASYFAPEGGFQFGNGEAISGKANVRLGVDGFFASIRSLSHRVTDVVESEDNLISRGEVTYTRHNGSALTVPFCNFFKMKSGLVLHYQIYIDSSKLYTE